MIPSYAESMYGEKMGEKHLLTRHSFDIGRNIPNDSNGIDVEQVAEEEVVYPFKSETQVQRFKDGCSWYSQHAGRNKRVVRSSYEEMNNHLSFVDIKNC